MNTIKPAVLISKIIATIQFWIGFALLILFGICTLGVIFDSDLRKDGFWLICIIFDVIAIALIISGTNRDALINDFKKYVAIITNDSDDSLYNIAATLNVPVEKVKENVRQMIKKKYFTNAYLDEAEGRLIIAGMERNVQPRTAEVTVEKAKKQPDQPKQPKTEMVVAVCKGCGAVAKVEKGKVVECEYCGSPIKGV